MITLSTILVIIKIKIVNTNIKLYNYIIINLYNYKLKNVNYI